MGFKYSRAIGLGVLASLPAWLGGDLTSWKLGVFALALAGFGAMYPPRWDVPRKMLWSVGVLMCWPLIGFLPRIFSTAWHEQLQQLGVDIGWFWTPQPWMLLDAWLVVVLGGFWFLCLIGSSFDSHETHMILRSFAISVVGLALVALMLRVNQEMLPWWEPLYGIGPFPNRNQGGNLYAISGLMLLALAAHESRNNRSLSLLWIGGVAVLFVATVVNGSRTGIALLLVGVMAWSGWQFTHTRKKSRAAVLFSIAALLLTVFMVVGGEALSRITETMNQAAVSEGLLAGRWEIWQDSLRLWMTAPLHGIGIGNFSEIFALYREKLVTESRVIHPDSDYVWWLSELGIIGLALLGWAIYVCLQPFLASHKRSGRRLRTAAFIAVVLFLGHALVDVSGHRLGTLIPALLWLRLTWPAANTKFQPLLVSARALVPAGVVMLIGLWFLLPSMIPLPLPNSTTVEKAKKEWLPQYEKSPEQALRQVRWAAKIAPLDWELHYCLGLGALLHEGQPDEAWKQWTLARTLEPSLAEVPYQEGKLWLRSDTRDIGRAWFVWREALKRRNMNRSGLLREMLQQTVDDQAPELEETLLFLASRMPELRHMVLSQLTEKEFDGELKAYLSKISPADAEQREVMRSVLKQWAQRRGDQEVADFVRMHSEWQFLGWPYQVRELREQQQHQQAYELMKSLFPEPVYPQLTSSEETRHQHLRRVLRGSPDVVSLYSFLRFDQDELSFEMGKEVVVEALKTPPVPPYIKYVVATYFAKHQAWPEAAGYMENYGNTLVFNQD